MKTLVIDLSQRRDLATGERKPVSPGTYSVQALLLGSEPGPPLTELGEAAVTP